MVEATQAAYVAASVSGLAIALKRAAKITASVDCEGTVQVLVSFPGRSRPRWKRVVPSEEKRHPHKNALSAFPTGFRGSDLIGKESRAAVYHPGKRTLRRLAGRGANGKR